MYVMHVMLNANGQICLVWSVDLLAYEYELLVILCIICFMFANPCLSYFINNILKGMQI